MNIYIHETLRKKDDENAPHSSRDQHLQNHLSPMFAKKRLEIASSPVVPTSKPCAVPKPPAYPPPPQYPPCAIPPSVMKTSLHSESERDGGCESDDLCEKYIRHWSGSTTYNINYGRSTSSSG